MNKLFVAALLFPLVAHAQIIGPVPTCDPSDPNCTIDNGCNGGRLGRDCPPSICSKSPRYRTLSKKAPSIEGLTVANGVRPYQGQSHHRHRLPAHLPLLREHRGHRSQISPPFR